MRITCKACDEKRHGDCGGTALYMDQDGPNHYVCECHCRWEINRRREQKIALSRAERFLRDVGLASTYRIVEREDTP